MTKIWFASPFHFLSQELVRQRDPNLTVPYVQFSHMTEPKKRKRKVDFDVSVTEIRLVAKGLISQRKPNLALTVP